MSDVEHEVENIAEKHQSRMKNNIALESRQRPVSADRMALKIKNFNNATNNKVGDESPTRRLENMTNKLLKQMHSSNNNNDEDNIDDDKTLHQVESRCEGFESENTNDLDAARAGEVEVRLEVNIWREYLQMHFYIILGYTS